MVSFCQVSPPELLSDFNETRFFLDRFSKSSQMSNFIKIRPVGAESFREDGRTDITKLVVALRTFAIAPRNLKISIIHESGPKM